MEISRMLTLDHFTKGARLLGRAHPTFFVGLVYFSLLGLCAHWLSFSMVIALVVVGCWAVFKVGQKLETRLQSNDLRAQLGIVRKSARIAQTLLGLMIAACVWLFQAGAHLDRTLQIVSIVAIVVMAGSFSLTVAIHGWMVTQFKNDTREFREWQI